jgi:transcriptional regulator with XRE-family HTH domain
MPDGLPAGRKELAEEVRRALEGSRKSLRQIAREAHTSPAHLSLIASGKRKPSQTTLENILRAATPRKDRKKGDGGNGVYLTHRWEALLVAAALALVCTATPLVWAVLTPDRTSPQPEPQLTWPPSAPPESGDGLGADDPGLGADDPSSDRPTPTPTPAAPGPDPSPAAIPGFIDGASPVPLYGSLRDSSADVIVMSAKVLVECRAEGPSGSERYRVIVEYFEGETQGEDSFSPAHRPFVDAPKVTLRDSTTNEQILPDRVPRCR